MNEVVNAIEKACAKPGPRSGHGSGPVFPAGTFRVNEGPFAGDFIHVVDLRSELFGFQVSRFRNGTEPGHAVNLEGITLDEHGQLEGRKLHKPLAKVEQMTTKELAECLLSPSLERVG